ncbi:MAG TPA: preprotein translocase subunit SecG [Candidatus Omnitrophota bacterium]|nr:preprotein translocase subunit SecG [Candidatus Omnitrophota bacterium]
MTGFVMFLHALVAIFLIVIILMQSGRGGGLTEGFASAESLFGAKTNEFMIKGTTIFATIFLITCLGLAVLSSQRGKSLMSDQVIPAAEKMPIEQVVQEAAEQVDAQVAGIEDKAATTGPVAEIPAMVPPEDVSVTVTPVDK